MTDEQSDTTAAARLLVDAFGRIRQLVAKATDGASTEALAHHPTRLPPWTASPPTCSTGTTEPSTR